MNKAKTKSELYFLSIEGVKPAKVCERMFIRYDEVYRNK
jgi:hypothetical protein